jgi:hypothetical protein
MVRTCTGLRISKYLNGVAPVFSGAGIFININTHTFDAFGVSAAPKSGAPLLLVFVLMHTWFEP